MKLIMPEYCRNFRCIADKCKDSCCIGWGIYIDDESAEKYRSIGGKFGDSLRKYIDPEEQCFINGEDHRCPFLTSSGLCDIILTLGEDMLCDICDRHPRYFEWFDDRIEGGIGLCCEEAARLVLSADGFRTWETDAPSRLLSEAEDDPIDQLYFDFLHSARSKIIAMLLDENITLDTALGRLTVYAELLQELTDEYEIDHAPEIGEQTAYFDMDEALEIMSRMETADEEQVQLVNDLKELHDSTVISPEDTKELRNIAVYFVWRYMLKASFSGVIYPKIMLAVFAVRVIAACYDYERKRNGDLSFEDKCRIAKLFSKIVEYSEDNLRLIMESYDAS